MGAPRVVGRTDYAPATAPSTSFTVLITLTALLRFTGGAIQSFVLALIIGIVSGTYSSIFNASLLLAVWEERDARRKGRQVVRASGRATS